MKRFLSLVLPIILVMAGGCSAAESTPIAATEPLPTTHALYGGADGESSRPAEPAAGGDYKPTVAAMFSQYLTLTPAIRPTRSPVPSSTAIPLDLLETLTAQPGVTAEATQGADPYAEISVYADQLGQDWYLQSPTGMDINFSATSQVHGGQTSIALKPLNDYKTFYLLLSPQARRTYTRDEIVGLSFWLNSGDEPLKLDDIAITVVGSNTNPYWVSGDNSAFNGTPGEFSETRLYDLEFNHSIPANTWVEVIIYPDELIYDPDYTYITGFYIKNNAGFLRTFYLDDINFLTLKAEGTPGGESSATAAATQAAAATRAVSATAPSTTAATTPTPVKASPTATASPTLKGTATRTATLTLQPPYTHTPAPQ